MTDKRDEALKLALEALERMKGYGDVFLCRSHEQKPFDQVCEAITAIREALAEQPAQQKPTCKQNLQVWVISNGKGRGQFSWEPQDERYWTRMEPAIKQDLTPEQPAQQQEPVARVINKSIVWHPRDIAGLPTGSPLYTSPQPSKPLTDEQEYEAIGTAGNDLLELAKRWADNEVHVYQFDNEARKIIKAVLHRAHGIKGDA